MLLRYILLTFFSMKNPGQASCPSTFFPKTPHTGTYIPYIHIIPINFHWRRREGGMEEKWISILKKVSNFFDVIFFFVMSSCYFFYVIRRDDWCAATFYPSRSATCQAASADRRCSKHRHGATSACSNKTIFCRPSIFRTTQAHSSTKWNTCLRLCSLTLFPLFPSLIIVCVLSLWILCACSLSKYCVCALSLNIVRVLSL